MVQDVSWQSRTCSEPWRVGVSGIRRHKLMANWEFQPNPSQRVIAERRESEGKNARQQMADLDCKVDSGSAKDSTLQRRGSVGTLQLRLTINIESILLLLRHRPITTSRHISHIYQNGLRSARRSLHLRRCTYQRQSSPSAHTINVCTCRPFFLKANPSSMNSTTDNPISTRHNCHLTTTMMML